MCVEVLVPTFQGSSSSPQVTVHRVMGYDSDIYQDMAALMSQVSQALAKLEAEAGRRQEARSLFRLGTKQTPSDSAMYITWASLEWKWGRQSYARKLLSHARRTCSLNAPFFSAWAALEVSFFCNCRVHLFPTLCEHILRSHPTSWHYDAQCRSCICPAQQIYLGKKTMVTAASVLLAVFWNLSRQYNFLSANFVANHNHSMILQYTNQVHLFRQHTESIAFSRWTGRLVKAGSAKCLSDLKLWFIDRRRRQRMCLEQGCCLQKDYRLTATTSRAY